MDKLIFPGWLLPMAERGQPALTGHALAIEGERIAAILPESRARELRAREVHELPQHALLPGLVNCHGHAAMSLLRGYADDMPLMPWLRERIWPAEAAHVSEEFVRAGTELAVLEMLRSGTTCFSDMYFFPEVVAEVCLRAGMRCQLAFPVFDFPSAWGKGADDYIDRGLALRDRHKGDSLLRVVFGPHAPYSVSEPALRRIATLAAELDVPVHIHLHETEREVREALADSGQRPLARLGELGLLGPGTQCVHMTELGAEDVRLLAASGASVIHCPESNMKLASGVCPVVALQAAGVNVALGTDSAASNNDLDLLGEARSAGLLAKLYNDDAAALPAQRLLAMATSDGARAMGRGAEFGRLEAGRLADIIAIDLGQPESQPVYHPASQIVYASQASQVTHSWIGGRAVLLEREPQTLDQPRILAAARAWRERVAATGAGA